jgi:protein-S-isoprenylcysteine O-methyltransferase Ste14
VTSGLYRWVRHPLYTLGLAFLWLTPVMTTSLLAFNVGMSVYAVIGSIFEERRLLAEFGTAYLEYRRRVPRLLPRPRLSGLGSRMGGTSAGAPHAD